MDFKDVGTCTAKDYGKIGCMTQFNIKQILGTTGEASAGEPSSVYTSRLPLPTLVVLHDHLHLHTEVRSHYTLLNGGC